MNRIPLQEWPAFEAIERLLTEEQVEDAIFAEPLFRRVQSALRDQAQSSPLDLAVLIRQLLRFQTLRYSGSTPACLQIKGESDWPTDAEWEKVGVKVKPDQDNLLLEALPWIPDWLSNVGPEGVDAAVAGVAQRRQFQQVSGDPFLTRFERTQYLSSGQRAAVRAALTTPPGATLLVCLPTGEGKSLIFQVLAEFGFGEGSQASGVTVVVTPTITLALDQERATRELGMANIPRAYIGGNEERNAEIAERIAGGTQGLCFVSPEAVCGRLRPALLEAARNLHLRALVIDEAHLVDAWGANFRPEFQLLSGVRHDLLEAIGAGEQFRTYLLSATLTGETVTTLQKLFGSDSDGVLADFAVCATARLRPEIDYWVSPFCYREVQQQRVLEAVYHLPRPAILYVTEVKQAQQWYQKLRQEGFRRLACVTGKSRGEERRQAVERWQEGSVDLMVATSAFGLGIDNAEVRTVIHACVPETLDRFYQEVGRGGRDGRAGISLIIPTERDLEVAQRLNQRRLISIERGLQRWRAMFEHPSQVHHGGHSFTVRLDVPPGVDRQDIDMVSEENTQWNVRTLTLMANAKLISLQGLGAIQSSANEDETDDNQPEEVWRPVQIVKIINPSHLSPGVWETTVESERQRLMSAFYENLDRMKRYLQMRECTAETLAPLYKVHSPDRRQLLIPVAKACGGCPDCRRNGRSAWQDPSTGSSLPWPGVPLSEPVTSLLGADQRLVIFCPSELLWSMKTNKPSRRLKRRFLKVLATLVNHGVHNLLILPGVDLDTERLQDDVQWLFFVGNHLVANQLPRGPSIVLAPPNARLQSGELRNRRQPDQARIFFLSEDFQDPVRLNVRFSETNIGSQWNFSEFRRRIGL